ncbi:hypothetical protein HQ560_10095 [bacterium]|nr:hypothetical protein [bacterium]
MKPAATTLIVLLHLLAAAGQAPGSAAARWQLASALEKEGRAGPAQDAYWAAYLTAPVGDAMQSRAREALLRLDARWQALFDVEKERGAEWAKLEKSLKPKAGITAGQLVALWRRAPIMKEEPWASTRDPLADLEKVVIGWQGGKTRGKGGVACLDMPVRQRAELAGKTVVVEAIEVLVEGDAASADAEVEVTAQVGAGAVTWGKPGEDPKSPVWVNVRRLGRKGEAGEPAALWARYYPARALGIGTPLVDGRMRGAAGELKLAKPLAASVRVESLAPQSHIRIKRVGLTLYLREIR